MSIEGARLKEARRAILVIPRYRLIWNFERGQASSPYLVSLSFSPLSPPINRPASFFLRNVITDRILIPYIRGHDPRWKRFGNRGSVIRHHVLKRESRGTHRAVRETKFWTPWEEGEEGRGRGLHVFRRNGIQPQGFQPLVKAIHRCRFEINSRKKEAWFPSPVFLPPPSWRASAFLRCHVRPLRFGHVFGAERFARFFREFELLEWNFYIEQVGFKRVLARCTRFDNLYNYWALCFFTKKKGKENKGKLKDLQFWRIFISSYL